MEVNNPGTHTVPGGVGLCSKDRHPNQERHVNPDRHRRCDCSHHRKDLPQRSVAMRAHVTILRARSKSGCLLSGDRGKPRSRTLEYKDRPRSQAKTPRVPRQECEAPFLGLTSPSTSPSLAVLFKLWRHRRIGAVPSAFSSKGNVVVNGLQSEQIWRPTCVHSARNHLIKSVAK